MKQYELERETKEMSKKEIDNYLSTLNPPQRKALGTLRKMIMEIIPEAEECISYGIPAFRLRGKVVAGIAAYKQHLSYFPHSGSVLEVLQRDLTKYSTSRGTLRFPVDAPLPKALVERLIATRLDDIYDFE
jgi:uncharacterized protein YdhG (YjbR/CyaY superfamily)